MLWRSAGNLGRGSRVGNLATTKTAGNLGECGENATAVPKTIVLPKRMWPQHHTPVWAETRLACDNGLLQRELNGSPRA